MSKVCKCGSTKLPQSKVCGKCRRDQLFYDSCEATVEDRLNKVEVCHIIAVVDFPVTAKLKEVNALTNLIYLCPSHHRLLDKGLIVLS